MKIYYHLTAKQNLNSIMEYGLIPQVGFLSELVLETLPAIYLFKELSEAIYAVNNWYGELTSRICRTEDIVLLKVRLPDEFEVKERFEWEVISIQRIPPEYLEEVLFLQDNFRATGTG